jgi:hypothetical protein
VIRISAVLRTWRRPHGPPEDGTSACSPRSSGYCSFSRQPGRSRTPNAAATGPAGTAGCAHRAELIGLPTHPSEHMSTTLLPPTWYIIKPRGGRARIHDDRSGRDHARHARSHSRHRQRHHRNPHSELDRNPTARTSTGVRAHRLHRRQGTRRKHERTHSPKSVALSDHHTCRRDILDAQRKDGDNTPAVND